MLSIFRSVSNYRLNSNRPVGVKRIDPTSMISTHRENVDLAVSSDKIAATMEDKLRRFSGYAGNICDGNTLGFEYSIFRFDG